MLVFLELRFFFVRVYNNECGRLYFPKMDAIMSSIPHAFYDVIHASSGRGVYVFTSLNPGSSDCFDQKNTTEVHRDSSGCTLLSLS